MPNSNGNYIKIGVWAVIALVVGALGAATLDRSLIKDAVSEVRKEAAVNKTNIQNQKEDITDIKDVTKDTNKKMNAMNSKMNELHRLILQR
jgi:predicted double-glycine peptidase